MRRYFKIFLLVLFCASYFLNLSTVFAVTVVTGKVSATGNGVLVRTGPGSNFSNLGYVGYASSVTIDLDGAKMTSDGTTGCPSGYWYYITAPKTGYVCTSYVYIDKPSSIITGVDMSLMDDKAFEEYLKQEGFPASYYPKLKELHAKYPNWIFKAVNTYRNWEHILNDESVLGMSLYQLTSSRRAAGYEAYLSTASGAYDWASDSFYPYDGSTWMNANRNTIAYHIDPRNFLTESSIFMFEDLGYNSSYTKDDVEKIIKSNYTDYILAASRESNVSAMFLASRIRQEGTLTTKATTGESFVCNGTTYSGYYNFYNIGATSGADPVTNGLCYAMAKGWNTQEKAIKAGAQFLSGSYINQGQYTNYFQKWNLSSSTQTNITHQYMTNIEAPKSESSIIYNSYKNINIMDSSFVFYIPYFNNMPEVTSLPTLGNPNDWLQNLSVDSATISGFYGDTTSYTINVPFNKTSIVIGATSVNANARIEGTGTISLTEKETIANIKVTAANGNTKNYKITILKADSPTDVIFPSVNEIISKMSVKTLENNISGITIGTTATKLASNITSVSNTAMVTVLDIQNRIKTGEKLATGDKVTITSGNDTLTYTVIIYGDTNGDGDISAIDLLQIQKDILGYSKLSGAYKNAADTNKDGSISVIDLLQVQKSILGYSNIPQL